MSVRRRKSQAAQRKRIHLLCRAADERREQGWYAEAEPLYLSALALAEPVRGGAEVAAICNNLAALKYAQGDFDQAGLLYRRALNIKEKLLGPEHPDVAMTLNNLAVLTKAQGRYIEAGTMYRRALAIFEKTFETAHPKAISCRNNYLRLRAHMEESFMSRGADALKE